MLNPRSRVLIFEEIREQFIFVIKKSIEFEEIPDDLILNWGHTGIHYVSVSSWTMARRVLRRWKILVLMISKLHMFQV